MWSYAGTEEGLGVYLHAEQDSFSHEGFGPRVGHLTAGHGPDKTYNDPNKADSIASDTYDALQQAGNNIGAEAVAIPYAEILPFIQAFNRAKNLKDKSSQLNLMRQHVDRYKHEHKENKSRQNQSSPSVCAAEFSHC